MAEEAGQLEDAAKMYESRDGLGRTKNAVALWDSRKVFEWNELIGIIAPRTQEIKAAFERNEKGRAFIYKLIALLRNIDSPISAPRLAYLLARAFEDSNPGDRELATKFYGWAVDTTQRAYFLTALEWYVYATRER